MTLFWIECVLGLLASQKSQYLPKRVDLKFDKIKEFYTLQFRTRVRIFHKTGSPDEDVKGLQNKDPWSFSRPWSTERG